jgi:hypothetical protein
MINGDAAFSPQLLNVPVGQSVAQVPADSQHDHVGRKPEPGETGPWRWHSSKRRRILPPGPRPPSANATDPMRLLHRGHYELGLDANRRHRLSAIFTELARAI